MSAFVGCGFFDGRDACEEDLVRMVRTMAHRAPDRESAWAGGPVGMAHRALWVTPESVHERYPVTYGVAGERLLLVADARLDNRPALLDALAGRVALVAAPRGGIVTDAEILLAAYLEWGDACAEKLRGDFAFAIWDEAAETLFAARDAFGVRPFYYAHEPGRHLFFASEAKAILASGVVPPDLDEINAAFLMAGCREDVTRTFYEHIKSLPGGFALRAGPDAATVRRFFALRPASVPADLDDEAYAEGLRVAFTQAVRCRIRSVFPVSTQLSGGLDSTAVACVARDLLRETQDDPRITAFTLAFDRFAGSDERKFALAAVAQGGLDYHPVPADDLGPLHNLTEVYEHLDDGLVGGTQHLVWAALKAARAARARVVLDGVDGDTVIGHGFQRLEALARQGQWRAFGRVADALAARYAHAEHYQGFQRTFRTRAVMFGHYGRAALDDLAERGPLWTYLRQLRQASRYAGARAQREFRRVRFRLLRPRFLRRRTPASPESPVSARLKESVLKPEAVARLDLRQRLSLFSDPSAELGLRDLREQQIAVLQQGSFAYSMGLVTQVAATLQLEIVHPFLDLTLIEYALALPEEQSLRDGWTRAVFRFAMRHTMPPEVTWRVGKADMTEPTAARRLVRGADAVSLDGLLARLADEDAMYRVLEAPGAHSDVETMCASAAYTLAQAFEAASRRAERLREHVSASGTC
ncbi:MAG: lasso peptide isopeptide bond-forming cyclase [Rubricoccaceae bacterium]